MAMYAVSNVCYPNMTTDLLKLMDTTKTRNASSQKQSQTSSIFFSFVAYEANTEQCDLGISAWN